MRLFLTRFVLLSRFTIFHVDFNPTKCAVITKMSNISRLGDTLESVLSHSRVNVLNVQFELKWKSSFEYQFNSFSLCFVKSIFIHFHSFICNILMAPRPTSFNPKWLSTYSWIESVPGDTSRAHCKLCNKKFLISGKGEASVKEHAQGAKHQNAKSGIRRFVRKFLSRFLCFCEICSE